MSGNILIIDDDTGHIKAVSSVLENEGFKVHLATNGTEAFQKLKSLKPDLIILDIMMGCQDEGFHVAYEIKKNDELSEIPLILLSAVFSSNAHGEVKDEEIMSASACLEKPVNINKLLGIVNVTLGYL